MFPGTEAARSGLRQGDILTSFDGETLDAYREQDLGDWKTLIEEYPVGEAVEVELLRDETTLTLSLPLEDAPRERSDADTGRDEFLECSVRELVFIDRVLLELPDDFEGVVVTECTSGGWAAMSGLRPGDVVLSINDRAVKHPDQFESDLKDLVGTEPKLLKIFVQRGIATAFVIIEPDWSIRHR